MANSLKYFSWPFIIFILAALVRVAWIGEIPGGLNQDEASTGYDAWALLTEGIDRHGLSWPVHFIAWGSGQNALYAYLSMPFIAVFGLTLTSIRLTAVILGIASVWIFWRLGKRVSPSMGVWALLVVATSPWHIMASRWGLEANIAPAVVLFATYCFVRARSDNIFWLPLGSAVLALSVYAYGIAYVFAPIYMIAAWACVAYERKPPLTIFFFSALCAFIIALPIMVFVVNNSIGIDHIHWGPITIPKYPGEARYNSIFLPFAADGWSHMPHNSVQVLRLLLGSQDDGLPWNASPTWGAQHWILTPFLMLGIAHSIHTNELTDRLMLAWFLCALAIAFCTSVNINRMNLIWLPSLWLAGRGLCLLSANNAVNRCAQIVLLSLGILFSLHYFTSWQARISQSFFVGLGGAITAILKAAPHDAKITITSNSNYTSTLFFARPSPANYVATVVIPNPTSGFQTVKSFGRFTFGITPQSLNERNYYVAHISELAKFDLSHYNVKVFGNYATIIRKPNAESVCYRPLDIASLKAAACN